MASKKAKLAGVILSVFVLLLVWFVPISADLAPQGQKTLALTLFAVIWWVFGVTHPAYTTLLLFLGYILAGLAAPELVFRLWTLPLMWLMIGAFLIAAAVTKSGLARRVAFFFMVRFARSYRSIVILVYVLGVVLSFLIPQPFPRVLLIMAMVAPMILKANANREEAASLGFAVFTSSTVTSMILLTGDSVLNVAGVSFAGVQVGWLEWAGYMAVPGLVASLLMLGLHFLVFRQKRPLPVDLDLLVQEQEQLGPLSRDEKITLAWVLIALALWVTDFLHQIDPAWVALGVAVGLSLPWVGEILDERDLSSGVRWPIVLFVVGALAIGTVGRETGMSTWLASALLPAQAPSNPYAFAGLVGGITMLIHMFIGSALASMSVVSPSMVVYATAAGWNPLFPALLVYTAVATHYIFPHHHVTILLGSGDTGGYTVRETIRYGLPLTLVTLTVMVVVQVSWWRLIGLI